ncbi:uncharacterized protein LOC110839525 isoform X3 [Zootermopsis nevadensis]|uniref:uncharacterized protein LOC110839525 isoform X3 n=1 Tax=Zootermopsis nevadensis TaxID=136037 RepID=UPI000B8E8217|nr:uncharacterized protein LOC110839525 isoform X3 [Zootermopsis nevadensis]
MDTGIFHLAEKMIAASGEIQEEYDVQLVRKVIKLTIKHKELVNKLLDTSDQCKDIINVVLSSTNTILDLMQKIIKSNTEELNLLLKITELTNKEWELLRKFVYLCNEDRYFVCKFMGWYLNGEGFGFPCSCSTLREDDCLHPTEGPVRLRHNLSRKKTNKTVSCEETKNDNPVIAVGENLGIVSRDLNEEVDAQMSGKEDSINTSKMHVSSLIIKNKINSVSVKSCCVKLEPLSLKTAVEKEKTDPDNSTQEKVSFPSHPENVELNSGNLTAVSDDKPRKVPAHLAVKEAMKITDAHNSFLTVEDSTKSVSEKRCVVQPEIESECDKSNDHKQECLSTQKKLRKCKITAIDNSMKKETSVSSENVESSFVNLNIMSEDETEKGDAHLSGKENKKIISKTCNSRVTTRKNSCSVPEKEYSVQAETENECVRSNNEQECIPLQSKLRSCKRAVLDNRTTDDISLLHNTKVSNKARICQEVKHNDVNCYIPFESECVELNDYGQEYLSPQTELRERKTTVTGNSTEKEVFFSSENVKTNCESLKITSEDKLEKTDAHLSGKKNKKKISNTCKSFVTRKNANSLSEKKCSVQAEIENESVRSDSEQETIQSKLRSRKKVTLDNETKKCISVPLQDMKVNNKAETCQEIKHSDVSCYDTFESKCRGEWSAIMGSSITEETDESPSNYKIFGPTDKVKSDVDIKYNRIKLCPSLKEMEFVTHGINTFTIATSMPRFLRAVEKKETSPVLVKKTHHFFTEARATYSSLEKYLARLKQNEKTKTHDKLSKCAFKMLQCMLRLQQSISQRQVKGGVNMNLIITDIIHVMDMVAEIVMVANEKFNTMPNEVLKDCCIQLDLEGHEPVGCATGMVYIPSDCELLESSTKVDQGSANCERVQDSAKGSQYFTDDDTKCLRNDIQVSVICEPTEFPADGPQVSLCHESMECSSSERQVPVSSEYTLCSGINNYSEKETITSDLSNSDTSSVIPVVQIKQEDTVLEQEITDLETSHSSVGPEESDICEETFTNYQDAIVKEEIKIEENPYFEDLNIRGEIEECSTLSMDRVDNEYQNTNMKELSTGFVCGEEMPDHSFSNDGYRHLQSMVPKINSQELMCSADGSLQNVENITERKVQFVKKLVFVGRTASETVKETGKLTHRMKPDSVKQIVVIPPRPFGAATEVMNEMDKVLGIHLPPFPLEQVGSLKWLQYTIAIDHPYSLATKEPYVTVCHICEICRKVFHSAYNVSKHLHAHFRNSAVACRYCGKRICSFELWTDHKQKCLKQCTK